MAGSGDSLVESARRRLKLWDVTDEEIKKLEESGKAKRTLTFYAPLSGFVMEKSVYKGMNVMPGTALYKLADLSVVWLYADIYEYELPYVRVGQEAAIQLSYLPGETFRGKAIYIYPALDPETRTAKVRFAFPNPQGSLSRRCMPMWRSRSPWDKNSPCRKGLSLIQVSARWQSWTKAGYFEPREIKVGAKVEDYYEVIKGLKAGERVVTSANFLIDSESQLKEAMAGVGSGTCRTW